MLLNFHISHDGKFSYRMIIVKCSRNWIQRIEKLWFSCEKTKVWVWGGVEDDEMGSEEIGEISSAEGEAKRLQIICCGNYSKLIDYWFDFDFKLLNQYCWCVCVLPEICWARNCQFVQRKFNFYNFKFEVLTRSDFNFFFWNI